MIVFPISYAILRHSSLYDCVRHFLFAVPLLCVTAALAARAAFVSCVSQFRRKVARRVVGGLFALVLLVGVAIQIAIMVRLHPYEYIFANQFTGGVNGAYGRYESDYWGESFKEASEKIQAFVTKEGGVPPGKIYKIAICGPWDSAMIYLPPDYERVDAKKTCNMENLHRYTMRSVKKYCSLAVFLTGTIIAFLVNDKKVIQRLVVGMNH